MRPGDDGREVTSKNPGVFASEGGQVLKTFREFPWLDRKRRALRKRLPVQ